MRIGLLDRLGFTGQFVLFSLAVLVAGMLTIGFWVQSAVEQGVINRTAGITALYVDSFISPLVQDFPSRGRLTASEEAALDRLITRTPMASQVVAFKIWSPEGQILYSPNLQLIGRKFEVGEALRRALAGEVVSMVSDLTDAENEYERSQWERLIETYAPLRSEGTGAVFGVSEFYQLPDALEAEIRSAQVRSWAIVSIATVVMYLLLVGMVRRATNTIRAQREELLEKVDDLRSALVENKRLQARVGKAASRTTTLNEQFLRRMSTDIHDGPAQDVALALMLIEQIAGGSEGNGGGKREDVERLRIALDSALGDLRVITHGLRAPNLEGLSACEAAQRAVTDFQRISGETVLAEYEGTSIRGSAPANITIYRVVQESLANSFKHAGATPRRVQIRADESGVEVQVADDGLGFDPSGLSAGATLGLAGMRERVELLGGTFTVTSRPGQGTEVRAVIPLTTAEVDA